MTDPKPPKKTIYRYLGKTPVKIATSNLFIDTGSVPVDYMVGVTFGQIGGQELINYSMPELSGDENISPIKDIANINRRYSSYNILPMLTGSDKTETSFAIKLSDYLPELDTTTVLTGGLTGTISMKLSNPNIYINSDWQTFVIKLEDSAEDLILEIDFVQFGDTQ